MTFEEIDYKGYSIKIEQDIDPESPRSWDNLGTMHCQHSRYNLAKEHLQLSLGDSLGGKNADPPEGAVISLPLFLYDHGGITMSTEPFSCPWDSGQVGIIYVSTEKAKAEYGDTDYAQKALDRLRSEVETYDAYLCNQVAGFVITDPDGCEIDSCWGYYPEGDNYAYCIEEAKSLVDWQIKNVPTYSI